MRITGQNMDMLPLIITSDILPDSDPLVFSEYWKE